jgi:hypothetical protein
MDMVQSGVMKCGAISLEATRQFMRMQLSEIFANDKREENSHVPGKKKYRVVGGQEGKLNNHMAVKHNESIQLTVRPEQGVFIEQKPDMFFVKQLDVVRLSTCTKCGELANLNGSIALCNFYS